VLRHPYWRVARQSLELLRFPEFRHCPLGNVYQAVRNVAAADAIAGPRSAAFLVLYDERNPYFAGAGRWPGWIAVLDGLMRYSPVRGLSLPWQQLLARVHVGAGVREWAREKHGIVPSTKKEVGTQSVESFERYASAEPFYPKVRTLDREAGRQLIRTVDVQARLAGRWHVENDPDLDFVYLDREIVLSRLMREQEVGHPLAFEDQPRCDVLLANAADRTPIIGEIKVSSTTPGSKATDRDPSTPWCRPSSGPPSWRRRISSPGSASTCELSSPFPTRIASIST
jgi:hypothetical protein